MLREWHLVPSEGTVRQGPHVELTDETKNAHSHGDWAPAEFSPTDLYDWSNI